MQVEPANQLANEASRPLIVMTSRVYERQRYKLRHLPELHLAEHTRDIGSIMQFIVSLLVLALIALSLGDVVKLQEDLTVRTPNRGKQQPFHGKCQSYDADRCQYCGVKNQFTACETCLLTDEQRCCLPPYKAHQWRKNEAQMHCRQWTA
ncbi:unnamed protein product [Schistocephalus solidus]|uniref:PSI_integrin domain-containing protein n=1 Tax=Schistocephalus solidus TaxID=70667 RepID=A0A183TLH8_SCHSO|nr:unnamed protein product [Schistocephalus solidus]